MAKEITKRWAWLDEIKMLVDETNKDEVLFGRESMAEPKQTGELAAANEQLEREITERKRVKNELHEYLDQLEQRLKQQAAELRAATKELQKQISRRGQGQEQLKKNKIGLHEHVSSVLEGVWIPQGVQNGRPPDESGPDRTGDSSEIPESAISSVFKDLYFLANADFLKPTREHAQDRSANIASIQTPEGDQTSQSGMAQSLGRPEESSVDASWTEQSESRKRVAYYRRLLEEPPRSLRGWIREKLFGAKAVLSRAPIRRRSSRRMRRCHNSTRQQPVSVLQQ